MGLLKKLFGSEKEPPTVAEDVASAVCAHVVLIPRWDNPDDMGDEDKASSFTCEGCRARFTPAEARTLRAKEAERVAERVAPN